MGTSGASTINSTPSTKSTTPGVDLYVGGTEHAVLHLLYARFWHKVLFDLGYVSTPEPFFKLVNQGLILGEDGQKMSKSRGNVVNPDDILKDYGADAFRLYEMFLGPLEMVKPWNTKGVEGVYRFLGRVWRLFVDEKSETEFEQSLMMQPGTDTLPTSPLHELPMAETPSPQPSPPMGAREKNQANASGGQCATLLDKIKLSPAIADVEPTPAQLKALHACIKKVTEDLDALRFNTAISALMVFNNEAMTWEMKPRAVLREFLILLQPFAPHLAEELWTRLHGTGNAQGASSLAYEPWPKYDAALLVESTIEMPVQVNGKLRAVIIIPADATSAQIEAAALACEKIKPFIEGKTIKKIIIVPKRMVNIAVG
jgi:leucyl-tRNA synthetase